MSFLTDTFNDTPGVLLVNHTSNSGHSWVVNSGDATVDVQFDSFDSAAIIVPRGGDTFARSTATPAAANYNVSAYIAYRGSPYYGVGSGVIARADGAATTGYVGMWRIDLAAWKLYRVVAGVWTELASDASNAITYNAAYVPISLDVSGTGATVSLTFKVSGTTLFSGTVSDSNASRITATGYPGLYLSTNASQYGIYIDSTTATDASGTTGTLIATEAADTNATAGANIIGATSAITEAADTNAAGGAVDYTGWAGVTAYFGQEIPNQGYSIVVEAADSNAGVGANIVTAQSALSEAADSIAVGSIIIPVGGFASVEAADTMDIEAMPQVNMSITERADSCAISGSGTIHWTLVTQSFTTWANRAAASTAWSKR